MIPDDEERMERAERIRKLRESGGRGRTGEAGDDAGDDGEGDASGSDGDRGDVGGDDATTAAASGVTGVELPDQEEMEAALSGGDEAAGQTADAGASVDAGLSEPAEPEPAASGAPARGVATTTTARARVLEFTLGEELYCIDIDGVEEIVARETVTRVPNTPEYVEGIVDLRGQITTIIDAKHLLDVDASGPASLLVVFAPDAFEDQGTIGWIVDEVRQVRPVTEEEVREPPSDGDHVEAILDSEDADELVVWVRPGDAIDAAVDGDEA